ncbi:hypothetical protein FT641_18220 [Bacillus paranthracis]|uniref:hypothetical protein n=1 Tax=Bacillus paranthracis TaxID=2026186 RepID=UPI00187AE8DA|nr:hypothetical protein [Bacillus paranthracis]MBE7114501.1 hypothetical protein [Bacillus paranthracis]MBE7154625.1 hypothetical protein [Bacillus paranthracis]
MTFFETKTYDLWLKAALIVPLNTTVMFLLSKHFGLFDFNLVRSFLISCVWFMLFYKKDIFGSVGELVTVWKDRR